MIEYARTFLALDEPSRGVRAKTDASNELRCHPLTLLSSLDDGLRSVPNRRVGKSCERDLL